MSDSADKPKTIHPRRRIFIFILLGIFSLCIVLTGFSLLSNLILPAQTSKPGQLSTLDKARLSEAFHLRSALGDSLWTGWGQANIPVIVYNEQYAFLVGYPDPPDGWVKVPSNASKGGPWEVVPNDTFNGQTYYRQRLLDPNASPQSFVVRIGDRWVASLAGRDWMEIGLGNQFKEQLPAFIQPIIPYRMAGRLFLSSAGGKDWYILGILHESFHAFEGILNPSSLYAAESIYNQNIDRYPLDNEALRGDWEVELNLLFDAVQAKTDSETRQLARQFLDQRQKRRLTAKLDADLVKLEQLKEWEEGLAKYTELTMWRLAATTPDYKPLPAILSDPGFKDYADYKKRWSQEIGQIKREGTTEGDMRFYYSGLAQAAILDRLAQGWQKQAFTPGTSLEDLVRAALK